MYTPPVLTEYHRLDKAQLVVRYGKVVYELALTKSYIAFHRAQESRMWTEHFWQDSTASVEARKRAADFQCREIKATVLEEQGTIDALTEERFLIEHLIEWEGYADAPTVGVESKDSQLEHTRDGQSWASPGSGSRRVAPQVR